MSRPLGRRPFVRGVALGASGIAAAVLIGCGDDGDGDDAPATSATSAPPATTGEGITTDSGRFIPFRLDYGDAAPKPGGTLRFRDWHDAGPLDPTVSAGGGTLIAANAIYERLIGAPGGADVDPFAINELEPELASKWENSPDGLVFTFTMQPGVTWQNVAPLDGRAFTAEDAAFAYSRLRDEGVHTQYFANVDSIVATDPGTLTVTLKRPQPDFIYPLATAYTTVHPRELVDDGTIGQRAVGTGPVLLERWEAGIGGDFIRNPDYWRGPIHIERFEGRLRPGRGGGARPVPFGTARLRLACHHRARPRSGALHESRHAGPYCPRLQRHVRDRDEPRPADVER